jgi:hypothetical protein
VLGQIDAVQPELLVLDSVQTISSAEVDGAAGGVTQVREVAAALIRVAKERNIATVLIGHVTKDGSIAGPRVLEHLVDVVLQFEGERHSRLRVVRATKNRYGPSDEIGCFDLGDAGLVGLPDPSGLFLSHGLGPVVGTTVTVTLEGRRTLVSEVQALVGIASSPSPQPRTTGRCRSGLSPSARWAWPVRSDVSRASPSGSPRRPDSASPGPSCRSTRAQSRMDSRSSRSPTSVPLWLSSPRSPSSNRATTVPLRLDSP